MIGAADLTRVRARETLVSLRSYPAISEIVETGRSGGSRWNPRDRNGTSEDGGQGQNRTADTRIFSRDRFGFRLLYSVSYPWRPLL